MRTHTSLKESGKCPEKSERKRPKAPIPSSAGCPPRGQCAFAQRWLLAAISAPGEIELNQLSPSLGPFFPSEFYQSQSHVHKAPP